MEARKFTLYDSDGNEVHALEFTKYTPTAQVAEFYGLDTVRYDMTKNGKMYLYGTKNNAKADMYLGSAFINNNTNTAIAMYFPRMFSGESLPSLFSKRGMIKLIEGGKLFEKSPKRRVTMKFEEALAKLKEGYQITRSDLRHPIKLVSYEGKSIIVTLGTEKLHAYEFSNHDILSEEWRTIGPAPAQKPLCRNLYIEKGSLGYCFNIPFDSLEESNATELVIRSWLQGVDNVNIYFGAITSEEKL